MSTPVAVPAPYQTLSSKPVVSGWSVSVFPGGDNEYRLAPWNPSGYFGGPGSPSGFVRIRRIYMAMLWLVPNTSRMHMTLNDGTALNIPLLDLFGVPHQIPTFDGVSATYAPVQGWAHGEMRTCLVVPQSAYLSLTFTPLTGALPDECDVSVAWEPV